MSKALPTATLGIAVAVFGLGVAGATSVAKTSAVPLAEMRLVSETSVPPSELAAAAINGHRRIGGGARPIYTYDYRDANCKTGELVAVDIR
jgi:hypothetical protein